ncbi:AAA family ATPase [Oceanicoccus sagamiensis]|uniref:Kinase n=1 Tax=Oceanicoccus sagamiensis TaxID=716816 RepID=A0A1X9NDQ8_9GAMM|nr:AAA family ATPase [Oceanicoccus sagamiensis]ARN74025.1 hypothetical protein BST96_07775 [Oceanicoccus sagamiensis]
MAANIVIIGGIPGTGKTTLATLLSKKIRAAYFNKDNIEAAVLRSGISNRDNLNGVGYKIMSELALSEIHHGRSVILDCIASSERVLRFWPNLVNQRIKYIECICSDDTLHRMRIDTRVREIEGWYELKWNDIQNIKKAYQPFSESRLILDSVDSVEDNLTKALAYIRE